MSAPQLRFSDYRLADRYTLPSGRVFLTGTQALVRILFDQARRDREAGLRTGGFVSGYRGSPLGGLDLELWRVAERLKAEKIEFLPAVNEDLAATAVLGSQQVETTPGAEVDGVCRRAAGCWWWPATTTAASPRRCRTSRTRPSSPGSCRC
jgi:indolepyruvate ferredoxin oxidoreductase